MVHSLMSICALKHVVFIVAAQHMSRTWIYCNERFHALTRQYAFWACAWFIAPKGCNAVLYTPVAPAASNAAGSLMRAAAFFCRRDVHT